MSRERLMLATDAKERGDLEMHEAFKAQAIELHEEANRASSWEREIEKTGQAAHELIEMIQRRRQAEALAALLDIEGGVAS
jgi:hypothetical protein